MPRLTPILIALMAAASLLGSAQQQASGGEEGSDKGRALVSQLQRNARPAPDFRLPARSGGLRTLADYKGRWLILNFWATWCPPCREEMPALSAAQERWKEKGVAIVGVSMDAQGWRKLTPFLAEHPARYEIVLGNPKVARAFGAGKVYPTTVVVDPKGQIVGEITTVLDEQSINAILRHLLGLDDGG